MSDAEQLERRSIFKGRVVDLSVDRARLPNGQVSELSELRRTLVEQDPDGAGARSFVQTQRAQLLCILAHIPIIDNRGIDRCRQ